VPLGASAKVGGSLASAGNPFLRDLKVTQANVYYVVEGERLTSFSIGPADCPQW
jgi:hypothetical protein